MIKLGYWRFWFLFYPLLIIPSQVNAWNLVTSNLPPYVIKEKNSGIVIDITKAISQKLGNELNITFIPWARAQEYTQQNQDILIAPLTRNDQRENKYDWILPLIKYDLHLVANKKTEGPITELLKERIICSVRNSPAEQKLVQLDAKYILSVNDESKCMHLLGLERVGFALLHGKEAALWGYRMAGYNPEKLFWIKSYPGGTIYLATSKGYLSPMEKQQILGTFQALKDSGKLMKIFQKYNFNKDNLP